MLRIAQERVIIRSSTIIPLLPVEYDSLIDKKGENFAIYRADRCLPCRDMGLQATALSQLLESIS